MPPLPKKINHLIGQALHDYAMLHDGDRILIGVSGGVDSLVLSWLLHTWKRKAPIDYELLAVHLDNGFGTTEHLEVEKQLKNIGIPYQIVHTTYGKDSYDKNPHNACFNCARLRRNHLFEMARNHGFSLVSLGHHKDDLIETFFLNMLYGGNISTMTPKQTLFNGRLAIIRPLAYLTKEQVIHLANQADLQPVKNPCPMAEHSKREEVRSLLEPLYQRNPAFRANIFSALSNVRGDYLLKPMNHKK